MVGILEAVASFEMVSLIFGNIFCFLKGVTVVICWKHFALIKGVTIGNFWKQVVR